MEHAQEVSRGDLSNKQNQRFARKLRTIIENIEANT